MRGLSTCLAQALLCYAKQPQGRRRIRWIPAESIRCSASYASSQVAAGKTTQEAQASDGVAFGEVLQTALEQVSAAQKEAQGMAGRFSAGDPNVNLQDVMVNLQKANLSFQQMVQVRNKLVTAYQDICEHAGLRRPFNARAPQLDGLFSPASRMRNEMHAKFAPAWTTIPGELISVGPMVCIWHGFH